MKLALVASIVVASITTLFAVQNAQITQVSFLAWYFEAPLVMVLLITFASGAVATFLALLPGSVRKSLEIKRLKSRLPPPAPAETASPPPPSPGSGAPPSP
jgi:uncharacterized integral membrane protein